MLPFEMPEMEPSIDIWNFVIGKQHGGAVGGLSRLSKEDVLRCTPFQHKQQRRVGPVIQRAVTQHKGEFGFGDHGYSAFLSLLMGVKTQPQPSDGSQDETGRKKCSKAGGGENERCFPVGPVYIKGPQNRQRSGQKHAEFSVIEPARPKDGAQNANDGK